MHLTGGDLVMFPRCDHDIMDSAAGVPSETIIDVITSAGSTPWRPGDLLDQPIRVEWGGKGVLAQILSMTFRLEDRSGVLFCSYSPFRAYSCWRWAYATLATSRFRIHCRGDVGSASALCTGVQSAGRCAVPVNRLRSADVAPRGGDESATRAVRSGHWARIGGYRQQAS